MLNGHLRCETKSSKWEQSTHTFFFLAKYQHGVGSYGFNQDQGSASQVQWGWVSKNSELRDNNAHDDEMQQLS